MKTVGTRIKELRKALNLRQSDIAIKIGTSAVAVGNWERETNEPDGSNLLSLAKILKTTPEYILHGDREVTSLQIREPGETYSISTRRVPLISSVQAGQWMEAIDNFPPGAADEWRETTAKVSRTSFALKVEGKSMQNPSGTPSIPHGSIVIVDPEIEATNGKIVVAKLSSANEVTIKRLVIDGTETYLEPLNPDYKPIMIDSDCTIVGVVKQVIQDI